MWLLDWLWQATHRPTRNYMSPYCGHMRALRRGRNATSQIFGSRHLGDQVESDKGLHLLTAEYHRKSSQRPGEEHDAARRRLCAAIARPSFLHAHSRCVSSDVPLSGHEVNLLIRLKIQSVWTTAGPMYRQRTCRIRECISSCLISHSGTYLGGQAHVSLDAKKRTRFHSVVRQVISTAVWSPESGAEP